MSRLFGLKNVVDFFCIYLIHLGNTFHHFVIIKLKISHLLMKVKYTYLYIYITNLILYS